MKKKITTLLLVLSFFWNKGYSQLSGSQPIPCDGYAYLIKQQSGTGPYDMFQIDLATGLETPYALNLISLINGIGYNVTDGYIWGNSDIFNALYRVGAAGDVDTFAIAPLPAGNTAPLDLVGNLVVGDIDANGIFYTYPTGESYFYRIDLNPSSPTYLQRLPNVQLTLNGSPTTLPILDWAINPIDGMLYAYGGTAASQKVYKIDPATGVVSIYTPTAPLPPAGNYGASYFDNVGNFYVSYNGNGDIYKITNIGTATNITLFSTGGVSAVNNDGARCFNACVTHSAGTDKTITLPTSSVTMDALATSTATWTQLATNPTQVVITDPTNAATTVTGFTDPGTYSFVWTVLGGCSDTVKVVFSFVLPVTLLSFDAAKTACNKVQLNWQSASEINFNYYDAEYSIDAVNFHTATRIPGRGDNSSYSFVHTTANSQLYYRLKMVDLDGQVKYSKVLLTRPACNDNLQPVVYPNPASAILTFADLGKGTKTINLYAADGKLVYNQNISSSQVTIPVVAMRAGVYTYIISRQDGKTSSGKWIKL
jgi:hypothetical protein